MSNCDLALHNMTPIYHISGIELNIKHAEVDRVDTLYTSLTSHHKIDLVPAGRAALVVPGTAGGGDQVAWK